MSVAGVSEVFSTKSGEGVILAVERDIIGCVQPSSKIQGNIIYVFNIKHRQISFSSELLSLDIGKGEIEK